MNDKIYYHGSNYKFDTFDKSKIRENKLGLMFNFTDDYSKAYEYGNNIIKAHLDLNNPLTEDDFSHILTYEEDCLLCDLMNFPKLSENQFEKEQWRNTETIGSLMKVFKMRPKFIEFLKKLGYDGIALPEDHHYGVFEPEQIHIIQEDKEVEMNEEFKKYVIYPKQDLQEEDDSGELVESIEVGKSYKLKGIDFGTFKKDDDQDDYKVIEIHGDTVLCVNQNTKEGFAFDKAFLIDPDNPDDKYTTMSTYKEEASFASLGPAPTTANGMVTVNGVPVEGKSVKKKKKKVKEDIEIMDDADPDLQLGDAYFADTKEEVLQGLDEITLGDSLSFFVYSELQGGAEVTIHFNDEDDYTIVYDFDNDNEPAVEEGISKEDLLEILDSIFTSDTVISKEEHFNNLKDMKEE